MCFRFKIQNLNLLAIYIRDFLDMCSKFQGENGISMSIKFHHLVHLPRLIAKFGPPRFFSTLNFEQHNHFLKKLMMTSSNWINPPETICNKYAQDKCIVEENLPVEIDKVNYNAALPIEVLRICVQSSDCYSLNGLKINGIKYTVFDSAIFLCKNEHDSLIFLVIEKIFNIDNNFYFFGQEYEGILSDFNQVHLQSLNSKLSVKYLVEGLNSSSYNLYKEAGNFYIVPYYWL